MSTMNGDFEQFSFQPLVGIARLPACSYSESSTDDSISQGLQRLAEHMKWTNERGPFGRVIPPGARVLVKPNFVLHQNQGSGGIEPLITHPLLIRVAVEAALRTEAAEVLVGDAPIQSCDLTSLLCTTGLEPWASCLMQKDSRFKGIRDFRRTTCAVLHGVRIAVDNAQPEERFVLFNLAKESLLEPITDSNERFRVSWYDPRLMARTHHPGFHQYLVAREVISADVVINLPKLKTHKKAGVTCALKNCIGINGNKEYLPHHRLGGSASGGDCYPGGSPVKRALEYLADQQNLTSSIAVGRAWHAMAAVLHRISRLQGDLLGIDGAWSGNDTIWRTSLDINRILLYGKSDATLAQNLQRRIIHVVDAVVAGQGDGPLAPDPLPLGLMFGSENAAAVDWVGARLLAYEPSKVPIVAQAFNNFRWPLVAFSTGDVRIAGDLGEGIADELLQARQMVDHPVGWRVAAATKATSDRRMTSYGDLASTKAEKLSRSWDA